MMRVESYLSPYGMRYATVDGRRVHPGNAYRADPIEGLQGGDTLVCVECEPCSVVDGVILIKVDHHRPSDPGYDKGPAEYWEASSLGQLFALLGGEPTQEDRVVAAMDHCFTGALQGCCPGVTREEVLRRKLDEISKATGRSPEEVADFVDRYRVDYRAASTVHGLSPVRDMRGEYLGEGYSAQLLTAQVAVALEGGCAMFRHRDTANGPEKWSLSGAVSPETVRRFMDE